MKRVSVILLAIIAVLSLSACSNKVEVDDSINVVFFTANEGATAVASQLNLDNGDKIQEPAAPIRAGFDFLGWFKDYTGKDEWDFATDTIGDTSMVLYAQWQPAIRYITYELNGGEMRVADYPTEFEVGERHPLPIASKPGFTFVSWFLYDWLDEDGNITTIPGDSGYSQIPDVTEDVTLYAHWESIEIQVKLYTNYPTDENGDPIDDEEPENIKSFYVEYASIIDFPQLEDTTNYRFVGWNSKSDGTGDYYNQGDVFERSAKLALFAIWEEK